MKNRINLAVRFLTGLLFFLLRIWKYIWNFYKSMQRICKAAVFAEKILNYYNFRIGIIY